MADVGGKNIGEKALAKIWDVLKSTLNLKFKTTSVLIKHVYLWFNKLTTELSDNRL